MAESVDALVSNTSGATRAGSTPALGTDWGEDSNLLPKTFFWLSHLLPLLIDKFKHFVVACGSKIRGFGVQGVKKRKSVKWISFFFGRDEGIRTLDLCNVTAAL